MVIFVLALAVILGYLIRAFREEDDEPACETSRLPPSAMGLRRRSCGSRRSSWVIVISFRSFDDVAANGLGSLPHSFTFSTYKSAWEDGGRVPRP